MSNLYFYASAVAVGAGLQGNKGWPEFDFRQLPLSKDACAQLANNYEYVRASGSLPKGKRQLLDGYISQHAFDAARGLYLPLADHFTVFRKFSDLSSELAAGDASSLLVPSHACFFGNALLIPENFGEPGFNLAEASKPILRATNPGFLIITLEIDCKRRGEFEQNLAWTRGKDGDFGKSDFAKVDRALCRFKDYRGHCIVFTGNRSLHFHLLFSTDHLLNCPADALSEARWGEQIQQAILMKKVHEFYWDRAAEIFREKLGAGIEFDRSLRVVTQWRRTPWALRTLDKYSAILDLPEGTVIPQLVLHEDIRGRASPESKDGEYCVPATFSVANPGYTPRISRPFTESAEVCCLNLTPAIADLQRMCADEWGPYPQPVEMDKQRNGDWLIKFRNHPADKNPSTIVQGHHRKLLLGGAHSFGADASFLLPDELTANEFGDYLALTHGLVAASSAASSQNPSVSDPKQTARGRVDLAGLRLRSKKPLMQQISERIERRFRATIMAEADEQKQAYRENLRQAIFDSRVFAGSRSILIKSAEGIGKSSSHVDILLDEAFYRAVARREDSSAQRFTAFAFRSRDQAETKAAEIADVLRERGCAPHRQTFVVKTFWDHYEGACVDTGVQRIAKDDFEELTLDFILAKIEAKQPRVYELLEERRKALWIGTRFDAGTVILFMSHKAAQYWQQGAITRVWHHPKFKPGMEGQDKLAREFQLADVVFDDPEGDDFYHLLPESFYQFLSRLHKSHPDWRNLKRSHRRDVYQQAKKANEIPGQDVDSFDDLDELMRLDLDALEPITVDFDAIPYGQDNPNAKGIYRPWHGNLYYIGAKPWLSNDFCNRVFLTTEDGVANVIEKVIGKRLMRLDLDHMPGLFPISIPLWESKRAKVDRNEERYISELADELRSSYETAIIVGDGSKALSQTASSPSKR